MEVAGRAMVGWNWEDAAGREEAGRELMLAYVLPTVSVQ